MWIKLVIMMGMMILLMEYNKRMKNKCVMMIKYFKIIPKWIMNKVKVTNYIRRNNLLEKIGRL